MLSVPVSDKNDMYNLLNVAEPGFRIPHDIIAKNARSSASAWTPSPQKGLTIRPSPHSSCENAWET